MNRDHSHRAGVSVPLLLLQIHFWEAQRQNESARVKTLFLPETGVKLKNLTGYTSYWVSIAAFNAAGDGPRSTPVTARTQQAGGAMAQLHGAVLGADAVLGGSPGALSSLCPSTFPCSPQCPRLHPIQ